MDSIREHFEQFGKVEAVRIYSRYGLLSRYCVVQFKSAESAEAALTMTWHQIGNGIVKVEEVDYWCQPDNPLLLPPEQDSPQQILNKQDDDCLRAVFKFLTLNDLCNAAEVCKQAYQLVVT